MAADQCCTGLPERPRVHQDRCGLGLSELEAVDAASHLNVDVARACAAAASEAREGIGREPDSDVLHHPSLGPVEEESDSAGVARLDLEVDAANGLKRNVVSVAPDKTNPLGDGNGGVWTQQDSNATNYQLEAGKVEQ